MPTTPRRSKTEKNAIATAPFGASRRSRRPRRRVRPSSFRASGSAHRRSGIASRRKKVRAVLICALHKTTISTLFASLRRHVGCVRNEVLRRCQERSRGECAFSISRIIPAFYAFFANAPPRRWAPTRSEASSSHALGVGAAEKKIAKLLTQKKCVASFRRNASHITTSDPNAPPSALRTRRSRPNSSGSGRAVRLPLPQCRGPLSRNCPARPLCSRRRDGLARRDSAANRIRADDPVAAGLPRRRASWLCLCYWASDTRHYAKPLTRSEPWLSRKLRRKPLRKR
jgi:hypothetical protein